MSVRTFLLPDLGEGLTEAELVTWLVAVGDIVAVDQPVAEVETAKSLVEVPSPFAGRVAQLHGRAGESVDVGRPLISVETAVAAAAAGQSAAGEAYREEEKAGSGNVLIGYGTPAGGRSSRRTRAARAGMAGFRGVGPEAPGHARAMPAAAGPEMSGAARQEAPRCISPLVRRLARDAGLKLAEVSGSGPDGLILRRDVEAAMAPATRAGGPAGTAVDAGHAGQAGTAGPAVDAETVTAAVTGTVTAVGTDRRTGLAVASRTPVTGPRRTIAANLSRSRSLIPEATVWVDVDATALMDLRTDLSQQRQEAPSLLAFLARFALAGLARFPELNTRFVPAAGDAGQSPPRNPGEGREEQQAVIETFDGVNLGIAVQTGRGLMVPSVRRADTLTTRGLDTEIRRLTTAAQAGKATPGELSSGTFTLNNYGVYGVDGSAAIINYPESAILGVGRIIEKPWVVSGQLAVRRVTQLTLVFDHRVCDGAAAGGFLRYVADAVESPGRILADL
ncbi:2-oxo acid dehydrogenase subunit E2 [Arthrobacter yangruifuii]|uniref:Dihydrolipoamide acetyltransferase component of pyruvate dehydrogenase complex n=1 Tax=Arthrobacter yangruifuii TaxID=2606616 RepID=A0A5N6MVF6_9MICC|nr:dihydrolipoamide acetyltransferase family protein [Arthrobacter yangruifuii]KAD4060221.1 2-oxo acid dehydrogenase subunit E2 [Arthrobacter yangruifuii]